MCKIFDKTILFFLGACGEKKGRFFAKQGLPDLAQRSDHDLPSQFKTSQQHRSVTCKSLIFQTIETTLFCQKSQAWFRRAKSYSITANNSSQWRAAEPWWIMQLYRFARKILANDRVFANFLRVLQCHSVCKTCVAHRQLVAPIKWGGFLRVVDDAILLREHYENTERTLTGKGTKKAASVCLTCRLCASVPKTLRP